MRSKVFLFSFLCMMVMSTANATIVSNDPPSARELKLTDAQKARLEVLRQRVEEIKSIDRSKLTKVERKKIRQELRDINKEAKDFLGKRIYLSIGAVIIIVLLLILIF